MSRLVTLLVLLLIIAITASKAGPSRPSLKTSNKFKCNAKDKADMDALVARIMTYGQTDRKFPQNKSEMKDYCREQKRLVARLEVYKTQCLKSRPKQVVSVIIYSVKSLINSYCRNVNSRKSKDLLTSAVCANAASFDYMKCSDEYVETLQAAEGSDSKKMLGQMCCSYAEVFKCIPRQAATHAECTEERIEHNANYIRGFFENSMNVMCGDYAGDSDRCESFEWIKRKRSGGNETASSQLKVRSFFSTMVDVLSNL